MSSDRGGGRGDRGGRGGDRFDSDNLNIALELTGVVLVGEEAIEGAEVAGDGLGFSVPVKAILQILSFVLFFFRVDICVEILAGM